MRDPVIAQLELLLTPAVEALGYLWWGCMRQQNVLRVYIDKPGGVSIEDCAKASHQLNGVLIVHAPIKGDYTLEVSSPGLDRPLFTLQQYLQFKGHKIKLRLKVPEEGQRNFQGIIEHVEITKSEITVQDEENKRNFRFENIACANLIPEFGD